MRPSKLRGARWDEFEELNGRAPLWRIPSARMKGELVREDEIGGDHLVPLSQQAVSVLKALWPLTGDGPLIFPSTRHPSRPMSDNAIGYLLSRAGYHGQYVPHGFRAAFSTIMNEWAERHGKDHDRAVIDLMLAHLPKEKVEKVLMIALLSCPVGVAMPNRPVLNIAARADDAAIAALVSQTVERYGGIDILVSNAGIQGGPSADPLDMSVFDRVIAVNLRSMVTLTKNALPHMAGRNGASVILISSISALRGNAKIDAYAPAKAGVAQLARNIAVQWGPKGVRANAIAPGLIDTRLADHLKADQAFMERRMQMTPLRRMGEAHEVAGAAVFLAAPAGGFVNGQVIVVDGGTVITDGS